VPQVSWFSKAGHYASFFGRSVGAGGNASLACILAARLKP